MPTTSTATTTTAVPATSATSTSTTLAEAPVVYLTRPSVVYSRTGAVHVEGFADRLVDVTVGGIGAGIDALSSGLGGRTVFWADLVLDPGVHVIAVTVADRYTKTRTIQLVTAIVDPTLVEQFGYLVSVNVALGRVTVDPAEWLNGEEAVQAAHEDGAIPPEQEYVDNDFYIRNTDPQTRVLPLADTPVIVLQACYQPVPCLSTSTVDEDTWADLIADPEADHDLVGWWWYGHGHLPYWFILDDGVVVQVQEQYLP
jgi:hypothetical protein